MADSRDREPDFWKEDWPEARAALTRWWAGDGLAIHVTAPLDEPRGDFPPPLPPPSLATRWLDPNWRIAASLRRLARTFYGGVAFPHFDTNIGPGSLGLFLGCDGRLAPDTVWYEPVMAEPETRCLTPDLEGEWWRRHMALIEAGLAVAEGRFLVSVPDLIENLDTLIQLRGTEKTLLDCVERPGWVEDRIREINAAFFECFDRIADRVRDPWGGNSWCAFEIWGTGRTAKVQCDFACAISPSMFRRFVTPCLTEQCAWLDNSLFHLDGTQALPHLDNLLAIDELDAIEWTPQAGLPGGGSPNWYALYRRIRAGGKGVQAVGVAYDEVEPLLDAVGPDGMFVITSAPSETAARELLRRVGWQSG